MQKINPPKAHHFSLNSSFVLNFVWWFVKEGNEAKDISVDLCWFIKKSIINANHAKYVWVSTPGSSNEVHEGCVYINNKGTSLHNKHIRETLSYRCALMTSFHITAKFATFYSSEWKKLKDKKETTVDALILFAGVWIM